MRCRHSTVFEDELARAAGADTELVFFLADREPGEAALDDERGDAAIAGLGIDRREDQEDVGLVRVGDPQLAAGEHVASPSVDRRARVVSANASLPEPASDSA